MPRIQKRRIVTTINWIATLSQVLLQTLSNVIFIMILHSKWYYSQVYFTSILGAFPLLHSWFEGDLTGSHSSHSSLTLERVLFLLWYPWSSWLMENVNIYDQMSYILAGRRNMWTVIMQWRKVYWAGIFECPTHIYVIAGSIVQSFAHKFSCLVVAQGYFL